MSEWVSEWMSEWVSEWVSEVEQRWISYVWIVLTGLLWFGSKVANVVSVCRVKERKWAQKYGNRRKYAGNMPRQNSQELLKSRRNYENPAGPNLKNLGYMEFPISPEFWNFGIELFCLHCLPWNIQTSNIIIIIIIHSSNIYLLQTPATAAQEQHDFTLNSTFQSRHYCVQQTPLYHLTAHSC